ncbi:lysophospholipase L1-like esterase [Mycolicibacterium sp. BK556]|nr:lysophospholipase L1-like esterase [Mycolicibacterium sp. BK556]MBB3630959.1 lysophospholipase L1-like esterase [Mycolicibacterium sp. BK607]MBB3748961.1 lysophospholipase L1-like esterase [Mycolicibacterium sp. BK634]TDO14828.1 lysophospholipase L1-like esterase [Mycobacterium sp. BK086]
MQRLVRVTTAGLSAGVVLAAILGHAQPSVGYTLASRGSDFSRIAVIGDSYTTGTDEGGQGPQSWTSRAWLLLASQGARVDADVAAEGGAGYGIRGNRGSLFEDLTLRAVDRDDVLVVFFGSRNDQPVDVPRYTALVGDTFQAARRMAPKAKFLVIGPPWPTADPPGEVLALRDSLRGQARTIGAVFIDPLAEGWFVGRPDLIGPDGVHPTDAGHAYMADKIAPLIRSQLAIPL